MVKAKGLGRGLDALLGGDTPRAPSGSDAVTTLESKELLSKYTDVSDARAVTLKATFTGYKVAQSWPSSFAPVVAGLSPTEQEVLHGLVIKMIRHLQQRHCQCHHHYSSSNIISCYLKKGSLIEPSRRRFCHPLSPSR